LWILFTAEITGPAQEIAMALWFLMMAITNWATDSTSWILIDRKTTIYLSIYI